MLDELKNPWKKTASQQIYDNPWISVKEDQVINPSGKPGIYGTVHFKNKAIGIIPLDEQKYTYLVGQYRYPLNEYSWEIPMGGGLLEIDILESAKRELKEETGLTARKWKNIAKIHTSNSVTDEEGYVFLAEELTQGETAFEDSEELEIKYLPFQDVIQMVMTGDITDSISIGGILKLARMLGM